MSPFDTDGRTEELAKDSSISIDNAAIELLSMYHNQSLCVQGGYPADIDWESFPDHVVVARTDDDGSPMLVIHNKEKVLELAKECLRGGHVFSEWNTNGEPVNGKARWEFFADMLMMDNL